MQIYILPSDGKAYYALKYEWLNPKFVGGGKYADLYIFKHGNLLI